MISRIFRGEHENAAVKRKRQIDTLKIFNDNVLELREDVEYQVQFDAGPTRMAIMVSLSPEFPLEKPVLRVSPPIAHSWCNEHSEITSAPGLLNFTVHSDLGRVVQAIIREFSKNPPQLQEDLGLASTATHRDLQGRGSPSYTLQRYPELPSTSYNSYYNSQQYPQFSSPTTNASSAYDYNFTNSRISDVQTSQPYAAGPHHPSYVPNCSTGSGNSQMNASSGQYASDRRSATYANSHYVNANYVQSMQNNLQPNTSESLVFSELNNLTNEELRKLGDDEDAMDEYLDKHTQLGDLNSAIDEHIDSVEKLAAANLTKEAELEELQAEVAAKVETVTVLKARYDNLIQKYNKLSVVFTPDHIKECLKRAADDSNEDSEKLAENFLSRKIDVERFLSTYVECRKLGQARRTKEEKLAHQLNELKRAGY